MLRHNISIGEIIVCHDEVAVVKACLSSDKIQVFLKNSKRLAIINPAEVRHIIHDKINVATKQEVASDLATYKPEQVAEAQRRYDILSKYLDNQEFVKLPINEISRELGVGIPRTYQIVSDFLSHANLSSLITEKRGQKKGGRRLAENIELIIQTVIDGLSGPASNVTSICEKVKSMCINANLIPPSRKTIAARVRAQNPKERSRKIYGSKTARQNNEIRPHKYPVKRALELVQIDHWRVDCEVVDEKYRKPIARPWLTTAIDVYTRVILGFYLTLDSPSALSNAMCMIHSVLPKTVWLEKYKLHDIDYPFYGLPERIHVDNGSDFKSAAFAAGCAEYGIKLTFRPPGTPHNGAHIERFFGTLTQKVRALPGATLSSAVEKNKFSNIPSPSMTMAELRGWITERIGIYHQEEHSALSCTPLFQWEESFRDRSGKLTLPALVIDDKHFRLSFLPLKRASIQRSGVRVNTIDYFSIALSAFNIKTKCIVRYNPMSLAKVWVKPEGEKDYIECTYSDVRFADTSLAEFTRAKKVLQQESSNRSTTSDVFAAIERNEQRVKQANQLTKQARLREEKKNHHVALWKPSSKSKKISSVDYSQPPKIYDVE
jgi:putative transposase